MSVMVVKWNSLSVERATRKVPAPMTMAAYSITTCRPPTVLPSSETTFKVFFVFFLLPDCHKTPARKAERLLQGARSTSCTVL